VLINKIKKLNPIIIGTSVKVFIKLPEVDHDVELVGFEKFIAFCSPLAPNIKNKTPNRKKTPGIPNDFKFLFFKNFPPSQKFHHFFNNLLYSSAMLVEECLAFSTKLHVC
jgi:hypothetical protein